MIKFSKNKILILSALGLAMASVFLFGAANNASAAGSVVVSEVQITGGPGKTTEDFVELYNLTSIDFNLKGHRLVKRTRAGISDTSLKSWTADAWIPAYGHYLWANSDLSILLSPNAATSGTISDDNGIALRFGSENTGAIIDSVAWGEAQNIFVEGQVFPQNPGASQSIERKPGNGAGNGEDTNNNANDFFISTPNPQNSGLMASTNTNTNSSANANSSSNSSINAPTNTNSGSANTNTSSSPALSNIIFNEVYPNPPDESTEFIELKNISGFAGSPAGWKVKDASGDEYAMPDKEIADGALWVIPKLESGISLNNDGETLSLINPAGAVAATLSIPAAPESQSYARSGAESFEWTIALTAGAENIFTQTVSAPAEIAAPVNTNSPASNVDTSNSNSSVNANASTSANVNSPKTATDFSAIKLSELMPNPEGDDADGEWIELYNGGDKDIDLAGGSLSDASGKIYAIPKNTIISAKSYKVFYRKQTGIVLNNDQDTIDLKDSSGKKIDSISYSDGVEGKSYGLAGKNWQWSDPTPAKANFQAAGAGANTNENTNSSGIKRVGATINEAKSAKSGAIITVSGIVTAAFGEIAKNTFYIQDDTGGMAVVLESAALEISRGDFVVVKGKMKTSGGEKILSADDEKKITVQSSGNNAAAWQMNIADIDSQSLGLFIGVNGKAVELTPKGFIIDDGSGSLAILPPGETSAEKGQIASIQGILKKTKDGIVLILRDKNDFISGNVLGESDQKNLSIAGDGKKYDIIIQLLIIIVTLLVGGYAARKYLQKYSYATPDTKPAEESKEDRDSNSGFGI